MIDEPNDTELQVLKHLWKAGRQSAREIHAAIGEALSWKPSTTRTLITRMETKGLVARRDVHGLAVFEPQIDKVAVLAGRLKSLTRDVLELDGPLPASFFAESPLLSEAEARELEALINQMDDGKVDE